ncbi:hypothetical protein [Teredinibacter purpureus]|uniref:hypothetical protein n=1 Tax=Teredinibacter purpureus TaxID=2731756 RepID=UPI000698EE66|nr:hypothetical protein [Teredinibacter purpureus]
MESMEVIEKEQDVFEITIDFEVGGDPNRIYKTMVSLLDSFRGLDGTLTEMLGIEITDSLSLEGIENGSLKTIIRNLIEDLPDKDLREFNVKRLIGHYLIKSKYTILRWCQETPKLDSPDQVKALEGELLKIAEESHINQIPAYSPPNRVKLLTSITEIQKSTKYLGQNDAVFFSSLEGNSKVSNGIEISEAIVREVLTREVVEERTTSILKVKKPDYLGRSKWLMKFQGHNVDVAISDAEWLEKFQNKEIALLPGDSIKGSLLRVISYGHDLEMLSISYHLESIHEIIEAPKLIQSSFEKF